MTAGLLLVIALLAPVVSRRLTGDFFSPPALAASAWCGTLWLFALRLLPYGPLQPSTRALIAGTIVCLVFGSALSAWWVTRPARPRAGATRQPQRPGLWVTGYAVVGLFGVAWYVYNVVSLLGWEGFADAYTLREALFTYRIPSAFLFAQLFTIVAPLVALAFILGHTRLPARVLMLPILCVLTTLLTTDRTQFFLFVLAAGFMAAHRFGAEAPWRRIAGVTLLAAVLLVGSFLAIQAWRGGQMPDRTGLFLRLPGAVWLPQTAGVAADPEAPILGAVGREGQRLGLFYVYLTVSYPALDRLVASPGPRWGGRHIFYPVLRPLQRSGLLDIPLPSPIPDSTLVSPPPAQGLLPLQYNQYTFLYYPFQDFGSAGALVYALVISVLVGAIYAWGRGDRSDPLRLLVVGQTATAVALTPFVNKFNSTAWWYILVLTTLPWLVARVRSRLSARRAGTAVPS
jgi:hypothetical protein